MTEETDRISVLLPNGSHLHIDDADELKAYWQSELEFWEWLFAANIGNQNPPRSSINQLRSHLANLSNFANQFVTAAPPQRPKIRQQLESTLASTAHTLWMPASDPRSQFAKIAAESEPLLGAFTWLAFVQPQQIPTNQPMAISGLVRAIVFEKGAVADSDAALVASLESLRIDWEGFSATSKSEYSNSRHDIDQLRTQVAELHDIQQQEYEEAIQERTDQFNRMLAEGQSNLEAISTTYDEKLALQAPVEYWKQRVKSHRNRSWLYALSFLASAVSVAFLVGFLSKLLFPEVWSESETLPKDLGYWRIAVMVAVAGFAIWPVRLLSRLLLSNLHLLTDAEERVTMLNTYLSLLRSDDGLAEPDRRLILEALFRTAATGIVRDDGAGISGAALVSKLVGDDRR